ncbi:MAG: PqqD family peptide modification chaperone [Acidobacteriota bacterium]
MVKPDTIVRQAREQVSCDLGGEAAILNLANGTYYGLDQVGARIWNLIAKPTRVDEIRSAVLEEYEVAPERCERDLEELLSELAEHGLIEVRDGAAEEAVAPAGS